jgi:hypothetical protein
VIDGKVTKACRRPAGAPRPTRTYRHRPLSRSEHGNARLPNWRRKACVYLDAGQNIPPLHYSHDNRTFYARFCWVGRLKPVHGRNVIPCSISCSQAGRRLSQPFMRRPSRMLRPRREMFAAPAASSRACTLWKTLSNSAARAFEARKSADGIRTRSPCVAISGMRP